MRMPPVLLLGRSPSAIVSQGVSWWIYVGRLVLLVSPAPLVLLAAASPLRRAPQGCLATGCLLLGGLVPLKRVGGTWWPLPPDYLLPGRPGPRKTALESPWWRAPRGRLLPRRQGRQGPSKVVRLWHHAAGLPVLGRRVPLTAPAAPWGRAPPVLLDRKSTRLNSSHLGISY